MTKSPWPQPPLSTRKEIVRLIEEGKPNEAAEILHMWYETPYPLKVFTPRQALESMYPCINEWRPPWSYVFSFEEWEELKEDYPSVYEKFWEHYGPDGLDVIEVARLNRLGWYMESPPVALMKDEELRKELEKLGVCPDIIFVSEKYIRHPAVTLHEFAHLLWRHLDLPSFPDLARIALPETWDKWTRDFLTGVKPEPWYPWPGIVPAVVLLFFVSIPVAWMTWITWSQQPVSIDRSKL